MTFPRNPHRPPEHGGTDDGPPIVHDFSTNATACGPAPHVQATVRAAVRERYPDPSYAALCRHLSAWHGVSPRRIVPCAGTSEGLRRFTLAWSLAHPGQAVVLAPTPGYADYAAAAQALGVEVQTWRDVGQLAARLGALPSGRRPLVWVCEPHNPSGASLAPEELAAVAEATRAAGGLLSLDRAYEPLRLCGADPVPPTVAAQAWQWWSPNKGCGLTGVRAAYAVAPDEDDGLVAAMRSLAPSWVLGAEGVAMLEATASDTHRQWLAASAATLCDWDGRQRALLGHLGWHVAPSVVPFMLARPGWPDASRAAMHVALRERGIKLRDGASFGLPGWLRLAVRAPEAQRALAAAVADSDVQTEAVVGHVAPDRALRDIDERCGDGDRQVAAAPQPDLCDGALTVRRVVQ